MVSGIRIQKMAEKIVYIPLDERPCNYKFPSEIMEDTDIQLVVPPKEIMGKKRVPAKFEDLEAFLLEETRDAYGAIISVDTLLYGGIVPSRLHHLDAGVVEKRLELLRKIKENNPRIKIYAFALIMRTPQGNNASEEPEYYQTYGLNIYLSGHFQNKKELGILTKEEREREARLEIPEEVLKDYLDRRSQNVFFNLATLAYVEDGTIDFLIIPQDDASEYGYAAMDQQKVRKAIKEKRLQSKVYMYPGADEVGCTLAARFLNLVRDFTPKVYVKYPSSTSATVVPCLEDRYLATTIEYQILAAGGLVVPSLQDADMVLAALMGAEKMIASPNQVFSRDIDVLCNLTETFSFLRHAFERGYAIGIADLFFLNGGSTEVLDYIKQYDLLTVLGTYSGWNTSSNALGTAIAQLMTFYYYDQREVHLKHLYKRYIEDIGYCGIVREEVTNNQLPTDMSYSYVKESRGIAAKFVRDGLEEFIQTYMKEFFLEYTLTDVNLPWARMFEVDFDIEKKS